MVHVAYIAPELGALTSTFVYREIEALRRRGVAVSTFSTRRPAGGAASEEARALVEATVYLYDTPKLGVMKAVAGQFVSAPGRWCRALATVLRDAATASVPAPGDRIKLLWHFAVGHVLARGATRAGARHIHAHFAHVPASIAMYAAMLAGIPFSFTAHANDIFERPTALREKTGRAAFTACISDYNRRYLAERGCDVTHALVVHCGIDVDAYAIKPRAARNDIPEVLAVGRCVEKKGFGVLLDALALLRARSREYRCTIVGDGPLFDALRARVEKEGLSDRVRLTGSLPQERVRELFGRADIFALPCVEAAGGDRDGIPVVLMEAMALGVPAISTRVSGIPELIEDGANGLLTAPGDAAALAEALERLMAEPELGATLAARARATIETEYNIEVTAEQLRGQFTAAATESD